MPTYPGQALLDAIENKRKVEAAQPNMFSAFGQGLGAGIVKGTEGYMNNALSKLADERKFNTDYILKMFDDKVAVRKKAAPTGVPGSKDIHDLVEEISEEEKYKLAQSIRKGEPMDPSIHFVPVSMWKGTPTPKEELTDIPEYTINPYTEERKQMGTFKGKPGTAPTYREVGMKPQDKEAAEDKRTATTTKDFLSGLNQSIEKTKGLIAEAGKFNTAEAPKMIKQYQAQLENYQNVQSFVLGGGDIDDARSQIQTFTVSGDPAKKNKFAGIDWLAKDQPDTMKVEGKPAFIRPAPAPQQPIVQPSTGPVQGQPPVQAPVIPSAEPRIRVVSPDGKIGTLPQSQVNAAIQAGYRIVR